jgi:PilZ domain-containing protein
MFEAAARNLRTAERFLLAPPLAATFGTSSVAVCDISARGARFRHDAPLEMGNKSVLKVPLDGRPSPFALEAVVVWTHADSALPGRFLSGVRTYAAPDLVSSLLAQLHASNRSNRIEELRSTDRFYIVPTLAGTFGDVPAMIEDLSARGARIDTAQELEPQTAMLRFNVPMTELEVATNAKVVWTAMKSISGGGRRYRAGLVIADKPELIRLAIGTLCEQGRASLDTKSLRLKLKIMRARARQLAPNLGAVETSGISAEQYLLIQGVREELRLNPEEAFHWYRRARISIADPATRAVAPPIADHPDALAVWEYLDRSVDPTIVGRAFALEM